MFEIVVVATPRRPPLITGHLKNIPNTKISWAVHTNPHPRFKGAPEFAELELKNHVGPFRCFRGHQEALRKCKAEQILLFEDDAVPNRNDWMQVVEKCLPLLDNWEIVSLHGRDTLVKSTFNHEGLEFSIPDVRRADSPIRWCMGSLAYLIKPFTALKIINDQYRGLPMDLYIASMFKFCVLQSPGPSPFDHDRRHGSLVENPR